jgi:hypothetical protein
MKIDAMRPVSRPIRCLIALTLATSLGLGVVHAQERGERPAREAAPEIKADEVTSLCDPATVRSTPRRPRAGAAREVEVRCTGKRPSPRPKPATTTVAPTARSPKAEINCSYTWGSGGAQQWLGCSCSANDDGDCFDFIAWCAGNGDQVGGTVGSASCSPRGP